MACGHQFRAGDTMTDKELWTLYQASKQTVGEIAAITGKSLSTIKRRLRGIDIKWEQPRLDGRGGFVHLDVTYWGRNWGVLLALDDATCRPLYVAFVKHETVADYVKAVGTITSMGYAIREIVIDGMRSLFDTFPQHRIQMCQFHMRSIVDRYLTKKPRLKAAIALKKLMDRLVTLKREEFEREFAQWREDWAHTLNRQTTSKRTGRSALHPQATSDRHEQRGLLLDLSLHLSGEGLRGDAQHEQQDRGRVHRPEEEPEQPQRHGRGRAKEIHQWVFLGIGGQSSMSQ